MGQGEVDGFTQRVKTVWPCLGCVWAQLALVDTSTVEGPSVSDEIVQ